MLFSIKSCTFTENMSIGSFLQAKLGGGGEYKYTDKVNPLSFSQVSIIQPVVALTSVQWTSPRLQYNPTVPMQSVFAYLVLKIVKTSPGHSKIMGTFSYFAPIQFVANPE